MTRHPERVLHADRLLLATRRGWWRAESREIFSSSQVDVVVSFQWRTASGGTWYGFRWSPGGWSKLTGAWDSLAAAEVEVRHATRRSGVDRCLIDLLTAALKAPADRFGRFQQLQEVGR